MINQSCITLYNYITWSRSWYIDTRVRILFTLFAKWISITGIIRSRLTTKRTNLERFRERALSSTRIDNKPRTFSTRTRSRDFVSETERIVRDIRPLIKERYVRTGDTLKGKGIRRDSTRSDS